MESHDRLSDYLLGELTPDERLRFEAELAEDPRLAEEVARLAPMVARLEGLDPLAWAPPEPPPLPSGLATPIVRRRWWQHRVALRPVPIAVGAAVLLGLGIVLGVLIERPDDTPAGRVITLAPVEPLGAGASGQATLAASGDQAEIELAGLPPSRDGEFYELWLLNTPDDLVSLGSFTVPSSGAVRVSVPLPAAADRFGALDLSVEPPDGNPSHSSQSLLRAPLGS